MNVKRADRTIDEEVPPFYGSCSSDDGAYPLTEADKKQWRKEVREREQKRIVPGFYKGECSKYSEGR